MASQQERTSLPSASRRPPGKDGAHSIVAKSKTTPLSQDAEGGLATPVAMPLSRTPRKSCMERARDIVLIRTIYSTARKRWEAMKAESAQEDEANGVKRKKRKTPKMAAAVRTFASATHMVHIHKNFVEGMSTLVDEKRLREILRREIEHDAAAMLEAGDFEAFERLLKEAIEDAENNSSTMFASSVNGAYTRPMELSRMLADLQSCSQQMMSLVRAIPASVGRCPYTRTSMHGDQIEKAMHEAEMILEEVRVSDLAMKRALQEMSDTLTAGGFNASPRCHCGHFMFWRDKLEKGTAGVAGCSGCGFSLVLTDKTKNPHRWLCECTEHDLYHLCPVCGEHALENGYLSKMVQIDAIKGWSKSIDDARFATLSARARNDEGQPGETARLSKRATMKQERLKMSFKQGISAVKVGVRMNGRANRKQKSVDFVTPSSEVERSPGSIGVARPSFAFGSSSLRSSTRSSMAPGPLSNRGRLTAMMIETSGLSENTSIHGQEWLREVNDNAESRASGQRSSSIFTRSRTSTTSSIRPTLLVNRTMSTLLPNFPEDGQYIDETLEDVAESDEDGSDASSEQEMAEEEVTEALALIKSRHQVVQSKLKGVLMMMRFQRPKAAEEPAAQHPENAPKRELILEKPMTAHMWKAKAANTDVSKRELIPETSMWKAKADSTAMAGAFMAKKFDDIRARACARVSLKPTAVTVQSTDHSGDPHHHYGLDPWADLDKAVCRMGAGKGLCPSFAPEDLLSDDLLESTVRRLSGQLHMAPGWTKLSPKSVADLTPKSVAGWSPSDSPRPAEIFEEPDIMDPEDLLDAMRKYILTPAKPGDALLSMPALPPLRPLPEYKPELLGWDLMERPELPKASRAGDLSEGWRWAGAELRTVPPGLATSCLGSISSGSRRDLQSSQGSRRDLRSSEGPRRLLEPISSQVSLTDGRVVAGVDPFAGSLFSRHANLDKRCRKKGIYEGQMRRTACQWNPVATA